MSAATIKGENGNYKFTTTAAVSAATQGCPYFEAIQALTDCTFSVLTDTVGSGDSFTSGPTTIPAGQIIFGRFTAFTPASGSGIAYKGGAK